MAPADDPFSTASERRSAGPAAAVVATLTREVGRLPLTAITLGLAAWSRTSGARRFAMRRGSEALQIVAHTPLGRFLPQQSFPDAERVDPEAQRIANAARVASSPSTPPTRTLAPAAAPTPVAPPAAAVEVGAPGAVTQQVEEVTEQLHLDEPETRADLPIPDFDNVSLGSLRARLRSLSVEQLVVLREWEQAHAHRLPVITLLDNRIAKLAAADTPQATTA